MNPALFADRRVVAISAWFGVSPEEALQIIAFQFRIRRGEFPCPVMGFNRPASWRVRHLGRDGRGRYFGAIVDGIYCRLRVDVWCHSGASRVRQQRGQRGKKEVRRAGGGTSRLRRR